MTLYIEDGHHRTYAAKILNKPLNVTLEIKDNPIIKLGYNSYDKCMVDLFNQVKSMNLSENFILKIIKESEL